MALKQTWGILFLIALAGCATKSDWATDAEANRVLEIRKVMYSRYSGCRSSVIGNPVYADYWSKTAASAEDSREFELQTNNKPISKAYRAQTREVSKDLLVCEADAFSYAKQITPAFGNAYGSSSSLITSVQVDVINGKYKTYGEMNRAYFDAMRKRQSVIKAATDKVANDIVAMYNQEASYKQQALANAVMMTSAINQSSSSGYNTNSSSTANTYQQPSPKGISSQQIGNQTIYSNGVTSQQIGNQTIYSNGVRCQQIGNQRICN